MTDRELKKLKRADLLELLLAEASENERLRAELDDAHQRLAQRSIELNKAGSIAEASLQLSGVFQSAQDAATRYVENVRALSERQAALNKQRETESQARAQVILAEAQAKCRAMEAETRAKCERMVQEAQRGTVQSARAASNTQPTMPHGDDAHHGRDANGQSAGSRVTSLASTHESDGPLEDTQEFLARHAHAKHVAASDIDARGGASVDHAAYRRISHEKGRL